MDEGQHIPGFKPYIRTYKPLDLDWKVKRLFAVDVTKIQSWYKDLEENWNGWKFIYGKHHQEMWKMEVGDPTGKTGHIFKEDTAWYVLCFNGDKEGPLPPETVIAKDEYKDEDLDELYPRKNFYGYGRELVDNLPVRSKRWMVTIHTPGTKLITHTDSTDKIRIHIPIHTNKDSNWILDGEQIHMEPGYAYLVNTSIPHSVENKGTTDRIHLYGKVWADEIGALLDGI